MNRFKYSFSIILISFAFVLLAVNARSFSETEDALNFTESLETNVTAMRSYELDCFSHWGDCAGCVLTVMCRYCADTGACTTDPYDTCTPGEIYIATCPADNFTAIYVGVVIACIILLICKGILLYCIIKKRRRVRTGMIIGQRNQAFGSLGESTVQVAQRNQEPYRAAAVHSNFKDNADHSSLAKF